MEILRLPETTSIQVSFTVANASQTYTMQYEDLVTASAYSASAISLPNKTVTFTLNSRYLTYAGYLTANIYNASNQLQITTGIDVVRPYCDITTVKSKLGITTGQCIEAERVARKILESKTRDFQFIRKTKEFIGMGMDYLPIDERIVKMYYLRENGELIYDYQDPDLQEYKISIDKTSIIPAEPTMNKVEYRKVWADRNYPVTFAPGNDYALEADFGYIVIPSDIQEACELLVQDLVSDNMKYYYRNISEFDNKEFKVKFADSSSTGTGNLIVDTIIAPYRNQIKPGVI